MTEEANKLLVYYYQRLRQNDSQGGKTSYRITVRQLESMIRLSEALARLHLDEYVHPKYVREAARLLKNSIIHIECEDISLEDEITLSSTTVPTANDNVSNRENREPNQYSDSTSDGAMEKKKLKISFQEFQVITNRIALFLRRKEAEGIAAVSQREIVEYLLEVEDEESEIQTEQALLEQAKKMRLVVNRLVKKERILIDISPSDDDDEETTSKEERLVALHPNFVLE